MKNYSELVARIFLAHIFILSGLSKISGYAGTQAYMDAMGVPGIMLPVVIIFEVVGGLALVVGFKTQWVASALAAFTAITALVFHGNFTDQVQMIMFMKNWAMAGGLMLLVVYGSGHISIDRKLAKV